MVDTVDAAAEKLKKLHSDRQDFIDQYEQTMPASFRAWIEEAKGVLQAFL